MASLITDFDTVATTTRAVRKRLDVSRPVSTDVILECLRIALQTPTAGNGQPWRWLIVTDAQQRAAVAQVYRDAALDMFRRQTVNEALDRSARTAYEGAVHLATILQDVPALVIPCILGRVDGSHNDRAAGFYGSIIPAVWSFQLALRSRGLGSTYTTAHLRHERQMAEVLGIPEDVTQVAMIPIAYTRGTDFRPAPRTPPEDVTFLDSWGSPIAHSAQ